MSEATISLSQEASIQAHLQIAKKAIETGENDLRRAADHIAKAQEEGASQREIASTVGKSAAWVNRLLSWHNSGYQDGTPFGAQSKASRERARVQAAERTTGKKTGKMGEQDGLAITFNSEQAAQAAGIRPTGEQVSATTVGAKTLSPATTTATKSFSGDERADLIETLELLATDRPRYRAKFALNVERRRASLGLTWDELLISAEVGPPSAVSDGQHPNQASGNEAGASEMPDIPEFLRRDKAKVTYGQVKDELHRCHDLILGLDPKDQQRLIAECVAPFVAARQSWPEETSDDISSPSGERSAR